MVSLNTRARHERRKVMDHTERPRTRAGEGVFVSFSEGARGWR
jgi:hypothetical protein